MKTAPAFCTRSSSASPSSSGTISCRCSGAMALATASACSGPSTRQTIPARGQRGLQVGPPARRGDDAVHLGRDLLGQLGVPGHQPGQPVGPVLGLHDQIDGGERRRGVRAGDDHDLGGAGEGRGHADDARQLALGLGHVGVARAGDDVDGRHAGASRRPWRRWPGPRRSGRPRPPRRWRRRTASPCRSSRRRPGARTARCSPRRPPGPAPRT